MLQLQVKALLLSKGITKPYTWLKKIGICHQSAYKLIHKPSLRVPINLIDKICEAAYCTPSDLFVWTPSNAILDNENHPLYKLKASQQEPINLAALLPKLSLEELKATEEYVKALREK